jgi:hypothetical protein
MAFFKAKAGDPGLPKSDRGSGSLDDYDFDLRPRKSGTVMRLEASDGFQDELVEIEGLADETLATITPARTQEEDGRDAPIEVRLFLGRRVSGPVGRVPRGLEGVFDQAVRRLDDRGDKPRIPATVVKTRNGLRVDLRMGETK